ncbi:MAG: hypothetical protein A2535_04000 [Burkholderiales bacterium RIFOXYD2_FULL_59_8]|nr:MAG: hypothetical protein A2535_04000 [Burkholderiales bacterium RIFOXYD2_FULL_59_8]
MACNACHSSCGDCSEGGITFKRVLRPSSLDLKPVVRILTEQQQPSDQRSLVQVKVSQPQRVAS